MAISWTVKITNVNLVSERGNVTATRIDDESALAPRVYHMSNTPMGTPESRIKILDTFKEWDESFVSKDIAVAEFLANLEQTAQNALESWEATR